MSFTDKLKLSVKKIFVSYWKGYPGFVLEAQINRHIFLVKVLKENINNLKNKTIVDIGGGWGAFSAICSEMGANSKLVEDFGDEGFFVKEDPRNELSSNYNFDVLRKNISKDKLNFKKESVDAFTTFDVLEHLHSSPREMLREIKYSLKDNGLLFIGVPNCVRLRKRITVLLGFGKWSDFNTYYHNNVFRGHVREYDVDDLKKIAEDLGFKSYKVIGRNWSGLESPSLFLRILSKFMDLILRFFPSLCDSIYLLCKK